MKFMTEICYTKFESLVISIASIACFSQYYWQAILVCLVGGFISGWVRFKK